MFVVVNWFQRIFLLLAIELIVFGTNYFAAFYRKAKKLVDHKGMASQKRFLNIQTSL